jgi:hypothetical protein
MTTTHGQALIQLDTDDNNKQQNWPPQSPFASVNYPNMTKQKKKEENAHPTWVSLVKTSTRLQAPYVHFGILTCSRFFSRFVQNKSLATVAAPLPNALGHLKHN